MRLAQLLSVTKLIRRVARIVCYTSAKRPQLSASAFVLESLESRLLLSASPVVDLNGGGVGGQNVTTAFTEQTPVLIAPVGTLTDADSANLSSLQVTLTARPDGNAMESLSLNGAAATAAAGLTVNYTAGTGVLSITGSATKPVYQSILQGLKYFTKCTNVLLYYI